MIKQIAHHNSIIIIIIMVFRYHFMAFERLVKDRRWLNLHRCGPLITRNYRSDNLNVRLNFIRRNLSKQAALLLTSIELSWGKAGVWSSCQNIFGAVNITSKCCWTFKCILISFLRATSMSVLKNPEG